MGGRSRGTACPSRSRAPLTAQLLEPGWPLAGRSGNPAGARVEEARRGGSAAKVSRSRPPGGRIPVGVGAGTRRERPSEGPRPVVGRDCAAAGPLAGPALPVPEGGAARAAPEGGSEPVSGMEGPPLAGAADDGAGKQDASGPVLVVGRIEVEDPVRGEEARHPKPHEVARPLAPEVERHHLGPHHGIGRRPGLGLEPENEEFGRQRTRPPLHPCVDPVDVGVDPAPCAGGEVGQGGLRPVVESRAPAAGDRWRGRVRPAPRRGVPHRSAGSSPSAIAGPRRGRSRGRKRASSSFRASTCGTPCRSRTTSTGAARPTRPARRPSRGATPGATGRPARRRRGGQHEEGERRPAPTASETRPCQLVAHAVSILHPSVRPETPSGSSLRRPAAHEFLDRLPFD